MKPETWYYSPITITVHKLGPGEQLSREGHPTFRKAREALIHCIQARIRGLQRQIDIELKDVVRASYLEEPENGAPS